MCLCPAARPSLIACQVTQLISVLPRTVYLKDTQHSFLGIRISVHRREHSVPLNQLGTPVNTRIQLSYTNFTERKKPSTIMKINELPILYHVAILKALFTKLLPFKLLIWLSLASFHCYSGTQVFEGAQLFVLSMSCCKIKKLHGSSPCWLC